MIQHSVGALRHVVFSLIALLVFSGSGLAQESIGNYRGTMKVVKFDRSPALRDIPPIVLPSVPSSWGSAIIDPPGYEGDPVLGPQTPDEATQSRAPSGNVLIPVTSFDTLPNQLGFSPPDPVGDIGPNHYVTMSNVHLVIHDRDGNIVFGPAPNNTLWSGFGGECQLENDGDPIVLYDQFADRWLLTQFTASGGDEGVKYYNCLAVSQTSDPMGPWYRWQVSNGERFPDYPKYGVGEEAYFISTRDFAPGYVGIGAFALSRAQLIAGEPDPTIISFFVDRSVPANVGDGLLPMDIDGNDFPPPDAPHYYFGTMDDGGPYGAPLDAVTVWEFDVDFDIPSNSSFELVATVPIAAYDTFFPCAGRDCIDQPDTAIRLDHQGYRQRPLHRAAYRNYGTHESVVFNQSVEADPGISGIRWWELRNPGASATIFQEGTFAPGNTDGIHRWFGSAAMDAFGNIALGYSVANTIVYPGIRYSGRLAADPAGTLPQGEGVIVDGTGSQTSSGRRWGDYTSMNVDPLDDCTFWYLNEHVPVTSNAGWVLHVGAFRFPDCDNPGFSIFVPENNEASVCQGDEAMFSFDVRSVQDFDMPVSLAASGEPAGTSTSFSPNPVPTLTGPSTLTVGDTGAAAPGDYSITITGTATGADPQVNHVDLTVFDAAPGSPNLTAPTDGAGDTSFAPTFEWTGSNAEEYLVELAMDDLFSNIIWSETTVNMFATLPFFLDSNTTYYWRVSASNACGFGDVSSTFSFTTETRAGGCGVDETLTFAHFFDFESGAQGWTSGTNLGPDTWALSAANPNDGSQHWHVDNVGESSDTFLTSPALEIPANLTNLTFRFFNFQNFEEPAPPNCWDGGMLEVSTDGGSNFNEVLNADLLTDPYDGPLEDNLLPGSVPSNPLLDRDAWCGSPQSYIDARVDINALAGESDVVFRFRVGTDNSISAYGWDIDDVGVAGCTPILDYRDGFESTVP